MQPEMGAPACASLGEKGHRLEPKLCFPKSSAPKCLWEPRGAEGGGGSSIMKASTHGSPDNIDLAFPNCLFMVGKMDAYSLGWTGD